MFLFVANLMSHLASLPFFTMIGTFLSGHTMTAEPKALTSLPPGPSFILSCLSSVRPPPKVTSRRRSGTRSSPPARRTSRTRRWPSASGGRSSTGSRRPSTPCSSTARRAARWARWPSSRWPAWTPPTRSSASEPPTRGCLS